MKKILLSICFIILVSCETAPVKTEVNKTPGIEKSQKIGIILRTPQSSVISREEIFASINSWLYGYMKVKDIYFIPDFKESLTVYASQEKSFYQLTPENEFLQHKSIGVLNQFSQENIEFITESLSENSCDLLLIFEVNAVFSETMQNMAYKTAIAVIDKTGDVIYFDHQNQYTENSKPGYGEIKPDLLNRISNRLADFLSDSGFIRKI
jgi:hypothetical protein